MLDTKKEVIKEAWDNCSIPKKIEQLTGCYWYRCNRSQVEHLKDEFDFIIWDLKECSIRPKSLQGIENNNGWIRIKSDDCFPNDNKDYWVIRNGVIAVENIPSSRTVWWINNVTHYQPIEKPLKPLY